MSAKVDVEVSQKVYERGIVDFLAVEQSRNEEPGYTIRGCSVFDGFQPNTPGINTVDTLKYIGRCLDAVDLLL